jgi:hypothetical protein
MLTVNVTNNRTTVTAENLISGSATTAFTNPVVEELRLKLALQNLSDRVRQSYIRPFLDCNFDYRLLRKDDDFATILGVDNFQYDRVVPVDLENTKIKVLLYDKETHLSGSNPQMYNWWCWNFLDTPLAKIVVINNLTELRQFLIDYGCMPRPALSCGCS